MQQKVNGCYGGYDECCKRYLRSIVFRQHAADINALCHAYLYVLIFIFVVFYIGVYNALINIYKSQFRRYAYFQ